MRQQPGEERSINSALCWRRSRAMAACCPDRGLQRFHIHPLTTIRADSHTCSLSHSAIFSEAGGGRRRRRSAPARGREMMERAAVVMETPGVELWEVAPVCFVMEDHVATPGSSPSPVTTDSTVSGCCSGQLLQNGCRGSAAAEKALNASR